MCHRKPLFIGRISCRVIFYRSSVDIMQYVDRELRFDMVSVKLSISYCVQNLQILHFALSCGRHNIFFLAPVAACTHPYWLIIHYSIAFLAPMGPNGLQYSARRRARSSKIHIQAYNKQNTAKYALSQYLQTDIHTAFSAQYSFAGALRALPHPPTHPLWLL